MIIFFTMGYSGSDSKNLVNDASFGPQIGFKIRYRIYKLIMEGMQPLTLQVRTKSHA